MSFTWKADKPLLTPAEVAKVCADVARARGLPEIAVVLALMCIAQESAFWCPANRKDPTSLNYPHDSESDDGRSVGYFQQQNRVAGENPAPSDNWWGSMASRMDLRSSCNQFMSRLRNINEALQGRYAASETIANVQNCREDLRGEYAKHWDGAWALVRGLGGAAVADNRPAFNEFPIWSSNCSDRSGTKVDLFLLHTQEGGGGNAAAENLANWFKSANNVSYHYTISQASDGGVTVVDCVDTDLASWSVLSANNRSINLCFAGSRASWTREDWLKQANAIDVAAYLAVQDCKKYGIPIVFLGTGGSYTKGTAGIADHQYVTNVLKDGTHTDVGPGFPKDVFNLALAKYAASPAPSPAPAPSDADRLKALVAELQAVLKKYGG